MSHQWGANFQVVDSSDGFLCFCETVYICEKKFQGEKYYHGEYVQAENPYLSGHSMSSIVSGRGTPLVSGNSRTSPPATNARAPVRINFHFTDLISWLPSHNMTCLWLGASFTRTTMAQATWLNHFGLPIWQRKSYKFNWISKKVLHVPKMMRGNSSHMTASL